MRGIERTIARRWVAGLVALPFLLLAVPLLAAPGCSLIMGLPEPVEDVAAETDAQADIDALLDVSSDADADGDAGTEADVDADGAVDVSAEVEADVAPFCGNGVVDDGEECDGDDPILCTTACLTPGTRSCVECRWAPCETSDPETCNGLDDDCDGETDEVFPCVLGEEVDCTTSCGSIGRAHCSTECQIPDPTDCPVPTEVCNAVDDDCDTVVDNGFACSAGGIVPCTTGCGTTGSGTCTSGCETPTGAACIPPAETCNGIDDDCDGEIDEDLWGPAPTPVRVTSSTLPANRPSLSWNPTDRVFGLVWQKDTGSSGSHVYFTLLDESGRPVLATDVPVAVAATEVTHEYPALTWSSGTGVSQWGVVWSRAEASASELYFRWVLADGTAAGGEVRVTSASGVSTSPSIAWNNSNREYGIAWSDARDANREIYFVRLTSSGTKPSGHTDQRVSTTSAGISARPWVVRGGVDWGIVWYELCLGGDLGQIYFTRMDDAGDQIPGALVIPIAHAAVQEWPRMVWNGSGWGMAWVDDRDGSTSHAYFGRLDARGWMDPSSVLPLTTAATTPLGLEPSNPVPAIGWDVARREYIVVWSDSRNASETCGGSLCGTELYFARLDATGRQIGSQRRITTAAGRTWWPALANSGNGWGLAWVDERDGNSEVYFTTLACR